VKKIPAKRRVFPAIISIFSYLPPSKLRRRVFIQSFKTGVLKMFMNKPAAFVIRNDMPPYFPFTSNKLLKVRYKF
jgi:hypothetical protein